MRFWALPAGLAGAAFGLRALSRGASFLARLAPGVRWLGEWGSLGLGALYLQLPILSSALLCGASAADLGRALPAILTADLQLAGTAQLLLLPVLTSASRVTWLLASAWVLPALGASHPALARALAPLDAAATLHASDLAFLLPDAALSSSLALFGFLIRTSSPRARST